MAATTRTLEPGTALAVARKLAPLGLATFPLAPRSKVPPLGTKGVYEATLDPEVFAAKCAEPRANIGLACGPISGVFVVDVDPRSGGDKSLAALIEEHGPLPETWTAKSGGEGDGRHYFFRLPEGVKLRGKLAEGVDLLSKGKYVVCAPSIHPDTSQAYSWIVAPDAMPVANAPAWLLGLARVPEAAPAPPRPEPHASDGGVVSRRFQAWMACREPAIQGAGGDTHTYNTARAIFGWIFNEGLPEGEGLDAFRAWNQTCSPPWAETEKKLLRKWDEGRKADTHPDYPDRELPAREPAAMPDADYFGEVQGANDTSPATAKPDGFNLWAPAAIWAPLPAADWLVDGLFIRASLGLIVAYGASLKTWLAIHMTLAGATGSDWLNLACKQVETCYIDFENGSYELRRRAHLIAKGHGYATPIPGFTFATMPGLSLADDGFFTALEPLTQRFGLIVIDSLAAGSGGTDENDARFAAPLNRLKTLAERSGCVIVVLHHAKKVGNTKAFDPREVVRGSSAIFNAADVVLQLVLRDDGSFAVRHTKPRGGKAILPFTVRLEEVGEDGLRLSVGALSDDDAGADGDGVTEEEALDVLGAAGTGLTESKLRTLISVHRGCEEGSKASRPGTQKVMAGLVKEGTVSPCKVRMRGKLVAGWVLGPDLGPYEATHVTVSRPERAAPTPVARPTGQPTRPTQVRIVDWTKDI